jgi:hypothetical protein
LEIKFFKGKFFLYKKGLGFFKLSRKNYPL